ncbi:hypothetical protein A2U01_0030386, partial [Trifolium medium]|nr:hypothetical protein [Trifolium medium]
VPRAHGPAPGAAGSEFLLIGSPCAHEPAAPKLEKTPTSCNRDFKAYPTTLSLCVKGLERGKNWFAAGLEYCDLVFMAPPKSRSFWRSNGGLFGGGGRHQSSVVSVVFEHFKEQSVSLV